jgi:hypothetical protein
MIFKCLPLNTWTFSRKKNVWNREGNRKESVVFSKAIGRSRHKWELDKGDEELRERSETHAARKEPQKAEQNTEKHKETGDGNKELQWKQEWRVREEQCLTRHIRCLDSPNRLTPWATELLRPRGNSRGDRSHFRFGHQLCRETCFIFLSPSSQMSG